VGFRKEIEREREIDLMYKENPAKILGLEASPSAGVSSSR